MIPFMVELRKNEFVENRFGCRQCREGYDMLSFGHVDM